MYYKKCYNVNISKKGPFINLMSFAKATDKSKKYGY